MNIDKIQTMVDNDGIVFLSYGSYLSQTLIAGMTESLEEEASEYGVNMTTSNNIFTIFIELSQNMMNYSKELHSNFLREKIEPKLLEIQSLDRDGIRKRYKELRKSGQNTHGKGGGIGFYEIAKRCDSIECEFKEIKEDRYYFHVKTTILTKKER